MSDNQIKAKCPDDGEFNAGFALSPGGSVEMVGNQSSCPKCGKMAPIPDGIYEMNSFGVVRRDL